MKIGLAKAPFDTNNCKSIIAHMWYPFNGKWRQLIQLVDQETKIIEFYTDGKLEGKAKLNKNGTINVIEPTE